MTLINSRTPVEDRRIEIDSQSNRSCNYRRKTCHGDPRVGSGWLRKLQEHTGRIGTRSHRRGQE